MSNKLPPVLKELFEEHLVKNLNIIKRQSEDCKNIINETTAKYQALVNQLFFKGFLLGLLSGVGLTVGAVSIFWLVTNQWRT